MLCKVIHCAGRILPIPGLISCAEVAWRGGLLSHAQNAARWLALLIGQVEVPQM